MRNSSGCPQARVDNINFGSGSLLWTNSGTSSNSSTMLVTTNFYGVADHDTLPSGSDVHLVDSHFGSWGGIGSYGDQSWVAADTFGLAGNFFVENNLTSSIIFPLVDSEGATGSTASSGGGRMVARYNHVTGTGNLVAVCAGHGTDSEGRPRGMRELECYHNALTETSTSMGLLLGARSGGLLSFDNTISIPGGTAAEYISLFAYRRAGNSTPWGFGAGLGGYDTNDGTTYASGTATGGNGSTTLIDTSKSWTVNQWQSSGSPYSVTDTTTGCASEILSNTSNTLTVIPVYAKFRAVHGF